MPSVPLSQYVSAVSIQVVPMLLPHHWKDDLHDFRSMVSGHRSFGMASDQVWPYGYSFFILWLFFFPYVLLCIPMTWELFLRWKYYTCILLLYLYTSLLYWFESFSCSLCTIDGVNLNHLKSMISRHRNFGTTLAKKISLRPCLFDPLTVPPHFILFVSLLHGNRVSRNACMSAFCFSISEHLHCFVLSCFNADSSSSKGWPPTTLRVWYLATEILAWPQSKNDPVATRISSFNYSSYPVSFFVFLLCGNHNSNGACRRAFSYFISTYLHCFYLSRPHAASEPLKE